MHSGPGRSPPLPARAGRSEPAPSDRPGRREGGGGGGMAAAPPHSWPSASAAILFSTEMVLAGLGSPPPPSQFPPPCSPSFPHFSSLRSVCRCRPPRPNRRFFLKRRVEEKEEGGYEARPCERRLGQPIGTLLWPAAPPPTPSSVDWLGQERAVPTGRRSETRVRRAARDAAGGARGGAAEVNLGRAGRREGPSGFL